MATAFFVKRVFVHGELTRPRLSPPSSAHPEDGLSCSPGCGLAVVFVPGGDLKTCVCQVPYTLSYRYLSDVVCPNRAHE